MAEVVEIVVKLTDQVAPAAKKITKELTAVQKAGQSLKKGVGVGVDVLSKIPAVAATAAAALAVVKKSFDFAEQGAQIKQMGESWEFLMGKLGVSPSILGDLSKAARGTVTEMQIMTSTATLLAGAGDELAKSMAEASPQLLEIAKAANKLNPSLGDTTFLYESIARGVKRASPLILDNLGIVIKIGDAYETFAKELGKSAKQLTTEERSMAVLNATLEAGDNLISQVGGNVVSATDAFAQLTTAAGETANLFKGDLFEALGPLIVDLAAGAMASIEYAKAVDQLGWSGFEAAKFIHAFGGEVEDAKAAIVEMARVQEAWFEEIDRTVIDGWAAAIRGLGEATGEAEDETKNLTEAQFLQMAAEFLLAGNLEAAQHYADLAHQAELGALRTQDLIDAMDALDGKNISASILVNLGFNVGGGTFWEGIDPFAAAGGGEPTKITSEMAAAAARASAQSIAGRGVTQLASGGDLTGADLVGEEGPELIINGVVIPANKTRELLRNGLIPTNRLAHDIGGGGGGSSVPFDPDFLGGAMSLGGGDGTTSVFSLPTSGGGETTSSAIVSAAVQAATTVTQAAAQETAAIVAAAISPQVTQQAQQILVSQARAAELAARNESIQLRILEAIQGIGTAEDTGESMSESLQFADFS